MSDSMTKEIDTDENNITKEDVLNYLAQNPDFLKTTPEAADLLVSALEHAQPNTHACRGAKATRS